MYEKTTDRVKDLIDKANKATKLTQEEREEILGIAKRASKELGASFPNTAFELAFVHKNIYPLRLQEFLNSKTGDFAHDVCGINMNLNPATGELDNFFEPRFTDYEKLNLKQVPS